MTHHHHRRTGFNLVNQPSRTFLVNLAEVMLEDMGRGIRPITADDLPETHRNYWGIGVRKERAAGSRDPSLYHVPAGLGVYRKWDEEWKSEEVEDL